MRIYRHSQGLRSAELKVASYRCAGPAESCEEKVADVSVHNLCKLNVLNRIPKRDRCLCISKQDACLYTSHTLPIRTTYTAKLVASC